MKRWRSIKPIWLPRGIVSIMILSMTRYFLVWQCSNSFRLCLREQASQSWNMHFDKIRMYGFIKNGKESYIYKWVNNFVVIFLVFYVDNSLLIKNDIPTLQKIEVRLSSQFSKKDLGEASDILEMKIYGDRSKRLLGLS